MSETLTNPATRTIDGVELPAAGTYAIDQSHTTVGFVARHLMVSKVRGRFGGIEGVINVAEDPAESSLEVTIDASSIDTRDEQRDGHLRSADFFHVEQHPTLTYKSRSVTASGRGRFTVDGDLTVAGVTRSVPLEVTLEGVVADPWGGQRVGFSAEAEIDREDFGLTWNLALEAGGFVVGKKIKIEIDAEAVRQ